MHTCKAKRDFSYSMVGVVIAVLFSTKSEFAASQNDEDQPVIGTQHIHKGAMTTKSQPRTTEKPCHHAAGPVPKEDELAAA
jgi:hypothetical protein